MSQISNFPLDDIAIALGVEPQDFFEVVMQDVKFMHRANPAIYAAEPLDRKDALIHTFNDAIELASVPQDIASTGNATLLHTLRHLRAQTLLLLGHHLLLAQGHQPNE